MGSSADLLDRETAELFADPPSHAGAPPDPKPFVFRPEIFFLGATEGAGVARDAFGNATRRCRVVTKGVFLEERALIRFEEQLTYDDGEVDVWRWAMSPGRDGRYLAAEAKAGAGITGERRGGDYHLAFRRPVGRATGWLAPRFAARFTLLSPDLALKHARLSLFGAPFGSLTTIHRRVES